MIFRGADGSVLGDIDLDNHIYTITVNKAEQKVKEPGGWAVEVGAIDTLFMLNCKEVQMVDKKGKTIYSTPFENFTRNGVLIKSDHGDKILVADEYWETKSAED